MDTTTTATPMIDLINEMANMDKRFTSNEYRVAMLLREEILNWKSSNARAASLASNIKNNMEIIVRTCEDIGDIHTGLLDFTNKLKEYATIRQTSAVRIKELCWLLEFDYNQTTQLWAEIKEMI